MLLVDYCNYFIDLRRLSMLWTVWHLWLVGLRFTSN